MRVGLFCLAAFGMSASAEDAQSILAKVREKQVQRWEGVDRYAVDKSVMGNRAMLVYEKFEVQGPEGKPQPAFRAAPVTAATGGANAGVDTKTMMTEYAKGMEMTGAAMDTEMESSGLPTGLLKGMGAGADPWVAPDPAAMMTGMAPIMRDMSTAEEELQAEATRSATDDTARMAGFAQKAKLVGTQTVDGRQAFHLRAEDLKQTQQADGQTFVMDDADIWIDAQEYVPLRSKITGTATSEGETRPIVIESESTDYRRVSGSTMYEPYRQAVRLGGLMTPEQEQQMREASAKLSEMDAQLAQMPESQRQMVMAQMGPQLEMMRGMADGGGMKFESTVHQIVVNPDDATLQKLQSEAISIAGQKLPMMPMGAGAGMAAGAASMPGATTAATAPMAGTTSDSDLKKAQQACLAQKVKEAEEANKKKRGLGRLMSAVGRVASKFGGAEITRAMGDVYSANATADDLAAAAKDLGLTEDDIEACRNPQ
jgi:hypothetical protein